MVFWNLWIILSVDFTVQKKGDYVLSYKNKCKFVKFGFKISYHTDLITLMNILAYWSSPRGEVRHNFTLGWAFLQIAFWPHTIVTIFLASETQPFHLPGLLKINPMTYHSIGGWEDWVPWRVSFIIFTFKKAFFTLILRFFVIFTSSNYHSSLLLLQLWFSPNSHSSH